MLRFAEATDIAGLIALSHRLLIDFDRLDDRAYRNRISLSGFLIGGRSEERFREMLDGDFLVYEDGGEVQGYLYLDSAREGDFATGEGVVWYSPSSEERYFNEPQIEISVLAVAPAYTKQGVAGQLLAEAEKLAEARGAFRLYSEVVTYPITNYPSLIFHDKHGFERAGMLLPRPYLRFPLYQSVLLAKRILV